VLQHLAKSYIPPSLSLGPPTTRHKILTTLPLAHASILVRLRFGVTSSGGPVQTLELAISLARSDSCPNGTRPNGRFVKISVRNRDQPPRELSGGLTRGRGGSGGYNCFRCRRGKRKCVLHNRIFLRSSIMYVVPTHFFHGNPQSSRQIMNCNR